MSRPYITAIVASVSLGSAAFAQTAALGLTPAQLEDADLVDERGRELGEVEHLIKDDRGRVVALAVEVDRKHPQPDKLVTLPLEGLRAVPEAGDAGDYNIVTSRTVDQVMALPEVRRR